MKKKKKERKFNPVDQWQSNNTGTFLPENCFVRGWGRHHGSGRSRLIIKPTRYFSRILLLITALLSPGKEKWNTTECTFLLANPVSGMNHLPILGRKKKKEREKSGTERETLNKAAMTMSKIYPGEYL